MIKFWRPTDDYGCFSNFSDHPIIVDNKKYATSEHYYQCMKTFDEKERERIRRASTPKKSKTLAHEIELRSDWEEVKFDVMLDALRAKVSQYEFIREKLLNTGDEYLAENSPYDEIWGLGKDGNGQNLLGLAWMHIRKEEKNNENI